MKSSKKFAIVIHVYYTDTVELIARCLNNSAVIEHADIYISLTQDSEDKLDVVQRSFPNARIDVLENKGRDIRPFFHLVKKYKLASKYKCVLKLHGKKTQALPGYGAFWLVDSLNKLIPLTTIQLKNVEKALATHSIIGPAGQIFEYDPKTDKNHKGIVRIFEKMNIDFKKAENLCFFGGSMLWFSAEYLTRLSSVVTEMDDQFAEESGQYDATFAHSIERAFSLIPLIDDTRDLMVIDSSKEYVRNKNKTDLSVDGLIREYEEFSARAVLVAMEGSEYIFDYNDLKDLQKRRYKDNIKSENAIRGVDEPDNLHTLLIKTQAELAAIKSSKKYRLLTTISKSINKVKTTLHLHR